MATYTPNLSLYMPDSTDDFGEFREEHNDNMVKIDNAIGGGGGSGGHTIVDPTGADMPQENKLQFTGAVSVSDDSANGQTVVNVEGGGGNVYGAFIDPTRVVYSSFVFDSSAHTWTATEDCILTDNMLPPDSTTAYFIRIGGKQVFAGYSTVEDPFVYVKKGQVVEYRAKSGSSLKAYGVTQGTSGIFTPIIYSDTERVVGVWRDNKPLYQRSYTASITVGTQWIDTGLDSGDLIVRSEGTLEQNNGQILTLASGDTGAGAGINTFVVGVVTPSKWSCLFRTNNNDARGNLTLTLYYTKGSDSAGSGNWNTYGVPTVHYSTSEQVIGTWIDGKPIYQKSVEIGTVNGGSGKNVAHGIADFKRLVGHECVGYNTAESAWNILSKVDNDASYQREFKVNATNITIGNSANSQTFTDVVATIRYTKVTD